MPPIQSLEEGAPSWARPEHLWLRQDWEVLQAPLPGPEQRAPDPQTVSLSTLDKWHKILTINKLCPSAKSYLSALCALKSERLSHICNPCWNRQIADCYPNEIFPGRLYLGDWHHASDAHVIETLNITHIVNISDTCENYLSSSHRK